VRKKDRDVNKDLKMKKVKGKQRLKDRRKAGMVLGIVTRTGGGQTSADRG
jgi:hypothetical protein